MSIYSGRYNISIQSMNANTIKSNICHFIMSNPAYICVADIYEASLKLRLASFVDIFLHTWGSRID